VQPKHQLYGAFLASFGLFKAKKLKATFGMTYTLHSQVNVIPILENIGTYNLLNIQIDEFEKGLFSAGVIAAIEIDTFRFFVKVSNLGYLWNSAQWQYINGIYLPGNTVRLGLTWDFWN
jgi:hypothetical protein